MTTLMKNTRSKLGLSQEAMGLLMGMGQSAICRIETGGEGRGETKTRETHLIALQVLAENQLMPDLCVKIKNKGASRPGEFFTKLMAGLTKNDALKSEGANDSYYRLINDIITNEAQLAALPFWGDITPNRQAALISMVFSFGLPRLLNFDGLLNAMAKCEYDQAAEEILHICLDSDSAAKISKLIRNG